jgi:hypothetical protein
MEDNLMKGKIFAGIAFVVLGLLIAFGPISIFPVCKSGDMKMACYYTAQAELWTGLAIVVLGAAYALVKPAKVRIGLSAVLGLAGVLTILFPSALTGVCKSVDMACHSLTLPALVILGAAVILVAAGSPVAQHRAQKKGTEARG